jgi:hypothetical protein
MSNESKLIDRRRHSFYIIDNDVIDKYGAVIGVYGIAVYNLIARHADKDGENSFPSLSTITKKLGIGRGKAVETIKLLVDTGLIECQHRTSASGDADSNLYTLIDLGGSSQPELPSTHPEPRVVPTENQGSSPRELYKDTVKKTPITKTELATQVAAATPPAPPAAPPPSEKEEFHKLKARWIARQSGKNVNHAQAGTGLNQLVKAGCTPDEFDALDDWLRTQSWVEPGATLYPQTYFKKLDQFRYVRERGGSSPQNNSYANHRMSKAEMSMAAVDRVFARLELEGGIYHAG